MATEMNKIIEISLAKIGNSKSRKVTGKSSLLHRSLLVNSLLNRVRCNDKDNPEPLMNYREPKSIDMELDEQDMLEKCPPKYQELPPPRSSRSNSTRKQSGLVSTEEKVQHPQESSFNSEQSKQVFEIEMPVLCCTDSTLSVKDSSIICECKSEASLREVRLRTRSKRPRLNFEHEEVANGPIKRIKCMRTETPPSKADTTTYSVTSLASLFSGLVANTEADSSGLKFNSTYVTAMMAC